MDKDYEEILNYCLIEGNDDRIALYEITNKLCTSLGFNWPQLPGANTEKLFHAFDEFIPIVLSNGFKVASGSSVSKKYELWPDQTPAAVTAKLRQDWTNLKGEQPIVSFIAYFFKNGSVPSKLAGFE